MARYLPNLYKKNIFQINYQALKQQNITCLLFDLDNTIAPISKQLPEKETIDLINNLKQDFQIILISNSLKKRVEPFGKALGIPYYPFFQKPYRHKMKHLLKTYQLNQNQIAIIGDQLLTDIRLGKKMDFYTIYVDPIENIDYKITSINRFLERHIINHYQKQHILERGKYDE